MTSQSVPDRTFLYGDARMRKNGRLPHLDVTSGIYFITFNLADALPGEIRERLEHERLTLRAELDRKRGDLTRADIHQLKQVFIEACERELDLGHGSCVLRNSAVASMVVNALRYFNGARYDLFTWSVMPNHVHVILRTGADHRIDQILHSWKSFTSKEANKILGRTGSLWQEDYFDRTIRSSRELRETIEYVLNNPNRAGLLDWPWVGCCEGNIARVVGHL
jgi:menaquinone-specific isochorismate synthase